MLSASGIRTASLLSLLLACGSPEPKAPEIDPAAAEAAAEALLEPAPADPPAAHTPEGAPANSGGAVTAGEGSVAEPVQLELKWGGIGALHKGFFADRDAVTTLSADLSGEVRSPAPIAIRYDSAKFVGQIRYQIDPDALERTIRHDGDVIQLQDLTGITTALARYRSDVAGRFDVRLESFEVGLESVRPGRACIFRLAGPPPPDGRLVSPCVEINGQKRCGEPTSAGVRFPAEVARDVRACLDLSR